MSPANFLWVLKGWGGVEQQYNVAHVKNFKIHK